MGNSNDDKDKLDNKVSKSGNKKNLSKPEYKYLDNTYGFVKKDVSLRTDAKKDSDKISKIKKYEKVKLISKLNGWSYVKYNRKKGYIKDKNIKKLLKEFIDVDISEQKLRYYDKNGEVVIKSDIVTGKNSSPTDKGFFDVYQKCTNYTMHAVDNSYDTFANYVLKFNKGELEYFHDALWRDKFGGDIYKTKGSHGCVNLPYKVAKKLYKKVDVGTSVLVHK